MREQLAFMPKKHHQSIPSCCTVWPVCTTDWPSKYTCCYIPCSLHWMTSSLKHAHDPLHSVHIQETSLCQAEHACVRKQGLSGARDETDVSWVWTNVFFFFRGEGLLGLTAGDGCPKSQQCGDGRQRWSETCLGLNEGGWGERLSKADVTPISSLCLNKSCSRSFYLHMLTGTSEFPEERCREEKMEGGKKQRKRTRKRTRKSCAHHCCKRLKWALL